MTRRVGYGFGLALAGGAAYGSNAPFGTLSSRMGVPAADVILWRAVLMLGVCLALARFRGVSLRVPPSGITGLALLAASTTVTSIAYLSSVAYVPVAVATVIFYTFPILILLVSHLVERERLTVPKLAVFAVAFVGIVLVVGPASGVLDPRGLILAALASAGAAAMFFAAKRAVKAQAAEAVGVWVHVMVIPMALIVVVSIGGPVALPMTWAFAGVFSVIAGSYVLGFLLQLAALKHISTATAGLVFLIEPIVAMAMAAVVLGERLVLTQYLGCAVVLAALAASATMERGKG
jgi:drug/metabolite transporter (DMT)-like permease